MRHLPVTCMVVLALLIPGGAIAAGQEPPETGEFATTGPMAQARVDHTATLLTDGRVLVVGGYDGDELYFATAVVWDPATGSFGPAGSLTQTRAGHTATRLPDGRVLVVGGYGGDYGNALVSATEIWDPATSSFSPAGTLESGRIGHVATLLADGRVLIAGGEHEGCCRSWDPAPPRIWDPDTETFDQVEMLSEPYGIRSATRLPDGRVLLVGGFAEQVQAWDPSSGSLDPAGKLGRRIREDHLATSLPDGRVLVVGGTSARIWDPGTASFVRTGSLAEHRLAHTATSLPDGRVLVVGDCCEDRRLASAVAWDPETGAFDPAGWLVTERYGHTATALPDGRVLVVGGWGSGSDGDDIVLASAELWDPDREWVMAEPMPSPKGLRDLLDRKHPRVPFSKVKTSFERASQEPQAMRSLQGQEAQGVIKGCEKGRDDTARLSGCMWLLRRALEMYREVLTREAWDAVKAAYDFAYHTFPRTSQRNALDRLGRLYLTDSVKTAIDLVGGKHPRGDRERLIEGFERMIRTSRDHLVYSEDTAPITRRCRKGDCGLLLFYAVSAYLLDPSARNWQVVRKAYDLDYHQSTDPAQRKELRGSAVHYFDVAADEYGAAQSFGPLARGAPETDDVATFFTGFTASTPSEEECTSGASLELIDGVQRARGEVIGCTVWVTTDPRMSGESVSIWNSDDHPASGDVPAGTVRSARERIVTEGGSWEGTLTGLVVDGESSLMSGWYVGERAHDGLMAYVTLQDDGESLWGYVSSEPPPIPRAVPER